MKLNEYPSRLLATLVFSIISLQGSISFAQNTTFTYQGRVTDGGTNFTGNGLFEFALVTSTNNSLQATATVGPNQPSGGFITIYTVTSGGSGYVTAPAVTVSGGGGTGATAIAHITAGSVTSISVGSPGNGDYTSAPTVTIAPPPPSIVYNTYWSNDGTSANGSEPTSAVGVGVTNGLFTVVIGDTTQANMTGIPSSIFAQPNLQLRIWFSDGVNGFAALSPLQNLTPTPYAVAANSASTVSGTVSAAQISGAVASANLSGTYGNALNLNNPGNNISGTFTGSGANLTTLNANNFSSGTIPLARLSGISSNQLDPATWQLATNLNGGYAALASNVVSGIGITNAFITNGIFAGNGAGLTNLTATTVATPLNSASIPAGTFIMGNSVGDADITDASPTSITVSGLYMDLDLVSYSKWQSVYFWATSHGYTFVNGGSGKAANHPVQAIDWFDSVKWCNARSQQAGLTPVYYTDLGLTLVFTNGDKGTVVYPNWSANGYRLPTEAEWEKAARGGLSSQRFPLGQYHHPKSGKLLWEPQFRL